MCDQVPGHHEYDSEMLATNAATLHGIEHPLCGGFHAFPCTGHYHVGHVSRPVGDACKLRHAAWRRGVPPEGDTLQASP